MSDQVLTPQADTEDLTVTAGPPPKIIPRRPIGSWIVAVVLVVLLATLAWSLWNNPNLDRHTVAEYMFKDLTLRGLLVTVELTVATMVIGLGLGIPLAIMRLSHNVVLRSMSWFYVWFFRGTPQLVQLIFWGYLGALYPKLVLGIPFTDVVLASGETSRIVTAFVAALVGLGLNQAAYASEIVRAGIQSVSRGQTEAALSLGMTPAQTLRKIILPQAARVIIPPMGNDVITVLKITALVSVIAGHDLFTNLQQAYAQNFKVIPLLVVACIWYLFLTSLLSIGQQYLERRYARGVEHHARPGRARSSSKRQEAS